MSGTVYKHNFNWLFTARQQSAVSATIDSAWPSEKGDIIYSAAHGHLGDVMMDNIAFLWLLLF